MSTVPLHNLTALNEEIVRHWVNSARTRGTADILYSCLITISLCVYTAVHLNIPPPGERPVWQSLRKTKWTLIGIFAPEIVLYSAWAQYSAARKLIKSLADEEARQSPAPAPAPQQASNLYQSMLNEVSSMWVSFSTEHHPGKSRFDLTYGYYAVMGGFRVDVKNLFDSRTSVALSPEAVLQFARQGLFLHVDETTIQDKSKADNLAKLFVCVQVFWMVLECLARKVVGYPLTILEIHTFVHVVCASAMYALWFKKPFNVSEATVVNIPHHYKDVLMCFLSKTGLERLYFKRQTLRSDDEGPLAFALEPSYLNHKNLGMDQSAGCPVASQIDRDEFEYLIQQPQGSGLRAIFGRLTAAGNITVELDEFDDHSEYRTYFCHLLRLSANELAKYKLVFQGLPKIDPKSLRKDMLRWRSVNFSDFSNMEDFITKIVDGDFWLLAAANFVQITYGAIHACAWRSPFPSPPERWMWRVSCILLAAFMPLLTCMSRGSDVLEDWILRYNHPLYLARWKELWKTHAAALLLSKAIWDGIYYTSLGSIVIILPFWVAARIFVVLESFISLRAVPIGVYAAVPWSNYIPHF